MTGEVYIQIHQGTSRYPSGMQIVNTTDANKSCRYGPDRGPSNSRQMKQERMSTTLNKVGLPFHCRLRIARKSEIPTYCSVKILRHNSPLSSRNFMLPISSHGETASLIGFGTSESCRRDRKCFTHWLRHFRSLSLWLHVRGHDRVIKGSQSHCL